jgi:uncharacterized protein (TIGR01777 family)
MAPRRIILPGGAGFIGRHLAAWFAGLGDDVVVLTRRPAPDLGPRIRHLLWDGQTPGPWTDALDGAHAVVNLAGRTVNCRYIQRHKREIYDSRLIPTKLIGEAIAICKSPPPVWINASSATIYRDARDRPMDEATGEVGHGFSVDVCQRWEAELAAADTPRTRKVALRSAMVFGPGKGGVFAAFRRLVRLGLGGTLGRGDQYVSWVHHQDFCRAVDFLLADQTLSGPVNVSSPNPVLNRDFMRTFRHVCRAPFGLPAARWMLEIGAFALRTETELLLKSRRVIPSRLLQAGFTFDFPDLPAAFAEIESANAPRPNPQTHPPGRTPGSAR